MDACEEKDKERESESDRKRHNPDLPIDYRIWTKKIKCYENDQRLLNATIDQNEALSSTMLYDLPLEVMDFILQKSYLHLILNSSTEQRDEEVIRSLISVDVCFKKRITRQWFKKKIWCYLKEFYGKTKKIHAIIRNNINYLEKSIQPNDELLASMLSLNCITKEQSHFIQRQRSTRDKNNALLNAVKSFNEPKFSNFVNCLRRINQGLAAKIIDNGGGVIKIQVQTRDPKGRTTSSMEALLLEKVNDLRSRTKPRSYKTDKLIALLRKEGLEILSSQLDGQTVVVWILCHSQTAIENLQRLYESNQLRDKYFDKIQPFPSKVINIDENQFKKTVVVRPITINVTQRIDMPEYEKNELMSQNENVMTFGVTKLRNEIHVLFRRSYPEKKFVSGIHVFQDRYPFRLQTDIKTEEMKSPGDIVASEKENCLYVIDAAENCVWKITRETEDHHKIIKWLTTDSAPSNLSMSRNGELLIIDHNPEMDDISSFSLFIYGSDAELIRSIPLTTDMDAPHHAVETSIGNFIICHILIQYEDIEKPKEKDEDEYLDKVEDENEEDEEDGVLIEVGKGIGLDGLENREGEGESKSKLVTVTSVVSELTRDGQMVIRRRWPSYQSQQHFIDSRLFIDSDDRVFVVNLGNDNLILFDSDFQLNQILCRRKDEDKRRLPMESYRFFYDEEMKQLIVVGRHEAFITVYSLSRN